MVCPHCSKQNTDGLVSCQWCGAALPQSAQPVQVEQPTQTVQPVQVSQPVQTSQPVVPVSPQTAEVNAVAVTADIPEEVKGWSWAGFLWTWIWAISNKTYIGLLALVPIPGFSLLMAIVLGIYGREWAWKNREWASVEEFKLAEKKWVKWWIILTVIGIVLWLLIFMLAIVFGKEPTSS